jgi:predicted CopG family antitoxin
MKSIKVSEETYKLLTELGKYRETMDEVIHRIA